MNAVRAAPIVIVLALVGALVASVGAQSPSAAPTVNAPVGSIPEKPPQFWTADGGTQGQWTALREHCRTVFSDVAAIQKMSPEQIKAVTPVPYSEYENCRMIQARSAGRLERPPPVAPRQRHQEPLHRPR